MYSRRLLKAVEFKRETFTAHNVQIHWNENSQLKVVSHVQFAELLLHRLFTAVHLYDKDLDSGISAT